MLPSRREIKCSRQSELGWGGEQENKSPKPWHFPHWCGQIPGCRVLDSNQRHRGLGVDGHGNHSDLGCFYPAGCARSRGLWYDNNGLQRQASEDLPAPSRADHVVHAGNATGWNKQINARFQAWPRLTARRGKKKKDFLFFMFWSNTVQAIDVFFMQMRNAVEDAENPIAESIRKMQCAEVYTAHLRKSRQVIFIHAAL